MIFLLKSCVEICFFVLSFNINFVCKKYISKFKNNFYLKLKSAESSCARDINTLLLLSYLPFKIYKYVLLETQHYVNSFAHESFNFL